MIGSTIAHYKILEKIGEGGMGVVYKAEDTKLKRIVALKFLPRQLPAHTADQSRFLQEAQAASALNHPNVCHINAIVEDGDTQFIDMEFVEGSTLSELISSAGSGGLLPIADALHYAVQISEALEEAQAHEIVHRDIKPDNIMVTTKKQVKVTDFGLAKLKGSIRLTKTASTVGTTAYMSPEQIQGADVDYRSDQFSFGVVLFEMLTGHLPFRGEHEAAMMYSIVNESPAPMSTFRSDVPPGLAAIVERLLSKDPSKRYARPSELVLDLKQPGGSGKSSGTSPAQPAPRAHPAGKRLVTARNLVIAVGALLVVLAGVYFFGNKSAAGGPIDSIAVLPFHNIGGDPNTEYLSDGISEHIINSLSRLRKLRVIPRSSSFHFKGKDDDPGAIGEQLNVAAVLTGRVIQRGDDLNIQAELIDVRVHSQLWGEQYEKKISELLSVQDQMEQTVIGQLHLAGDETAAPAKRPTESNEAYQLYLRGRYYWDKRNVAGIGKALQYYQQALDADPNYALAQTGVADCYDLLGLGIYNGLPPQEALPKAKAALERAFGLDSTLTQAYTTRAHMNQSFEWDWPRAEHDFLRAIQLNPKFATAHVFFASFLNAMGRRKEAMEQFQTAVELEPLSLPINTWLGMEYYYNKEYDRSIEQLRKSIDLDPTFVNAHLMLAWPLIEKGMTREAVSELRISRTLSGDNPVAVAGLVYALARDGQARQAKSLLDTLLSASRARYISPHNLAVAYLGIGDTVNFFRQLDKTVDEHAFIVTVAVLRVDPFFDFAHRDPGYLALFKKTGLPELAN